MSISENFDHLPVSSCFLPHVFCMNSGERWTRSKFHTQNKGGGEGCSLSDELSILHTLKKGPGNEPCEPTISLLTIWPGQRSEAVEVSISKPLTFRSRSSLSLSCVCVYVFMG